MCLEESKEGRSKLYRKIPGRKHCFSPGIFAAGTSVFTIISLFFPQVYYGFGFLAGCVAFFLFSVLRLDYYTKRLPYYILSVQPVVQEEKTGIFTELGYFLDKKLEGRQELEKI